MERVILLTVTEHVVLLTVMEHAEDLIEKSDTALHSDAKDTLYLSCVNYHN
jgi:hypothetical protein